MPTLRELITDIHANPAAYTDAFPVSEPEYPHLNPPSDEIRGVSLTATSVQIHEYERTYQNSYGRPPAGLPFYIDRHGRPTVTREDAERVFPPVNMPAGEIHGDGSGAFGYITTPVREEDGRLVIPPIEIPSSEPAFEWEIPAGFALQPIEREPEPTAPSSDRFYLDAEGELQFGQPTTPAPGLGPVTRAVINSMPCGCMQTDCPRCGPWLVPYPEQS